MPNKKKLHFVVVKRIINDSATHLSMQSLHCKPIECIQISVKSITKNGYYRNRSSLAKVAIQTMREKKQIHVTSL